MGELIICGVDVGSRAAKSVIMRGADVLSQSITMTGVDSEQSARLAIEEALRPIELSWADLNAIVATGYGRLRLPFAAYNVTEITCHARGSRHLFPDVGTLIDIGGQDCKAIAIADNGRVLEFYMNDKCAAGTGRSLERIASSLGVPLDRIGPLSLLPVKESIRVDTYCALFAQMDVLGLVNAGKSVTDVLAAVMDGFASRIWSMVERIGLRAELSLSGGVGKNVGIVERIEAKLGRRLRMAPEPQIVGALGAALVGRDKLARSP